VYIMGRAIFANRQIHESVKLFISREDVRSRLLIFYILSIGIYRRQTIFIICALSTKVTLFWRNRWFMSDHLLVFLSEPIIFVYSFHMRVSFPDTDSCLNICSESK
jgi:hypothetical protein